MGEVASTVAALIDGRRVPREEVHSWARAKLSDGEPLPSLLVVNVSPNGLMARCDVALVVGQQFHVHLPVVGLLKAEIRWCLGGRIGAEFKYAIGLGEFADMLQQMRRST